MDRKIKPDLLVSFAPVRNVLVKLVLELEDDVIAHQGEPDLSHPDAGK